MSDTVITFLKKYKITILCIIYLILIAAFSGERKLNMTAIVATISCISFILVLNILAKFKYSLPFSVLFILIIGFDAFFSFRYGTTMSMLIMGSLFETDFIEASEAVKQVIFIAIPLLAITSFLILYSQKELKNSKLSVSKSAIILAIYLLVFIPIISFVKIKRDTASQVFILLDPLLTVESMTKTIVPVFYGDFLTFGVYQYKKQQLISFSHIERGLPTGMTFSEKDSQPEKIYFIIGETARRDHFSLYGYDANKTTPFLDSLFLNKKDNVAFYEGVSPAPLTREALRIVLSFASPLDEKAFFEYKNLVELAKAAGYETLWISNQDKMGIGDGYVGFVSSMADFKSYRDRMVDGKLEDLNLVEIVKKHSVPNRKQIFFIHLVGSHSAYDQRYDDIDKQQIPGNDIKTHYDRSIHHTDRVLHKIYDLMQANDDNALMYYFSDHGEVIGKGHAMGWQQDYRVPLLAITTDSCSVDSKQIIEKYRDQESGLINTLSTIYIVAEMLGYNVPDSLTYKAVDNGKYVLNKNYLPELFKNIKTAEE